MFRALRIRRALRRIDRAHERLQIVSGDEVSATIRELREAQDAWLDLDGRERFTCGRRGDFLSPGYAERDRDHITDDDACSYCGSWSGDLFMEAVGLAAIVVPTDKNYKAYIYPPGRADLQRKFYFQHLSTEQMQRLVEMINLDQLRFASPGYFYRRPFFVGATQAPQRPPPDETP